MGNITPAMITLQPSMTLPEVVIPYSQASGAFECLPGGDMDQRLADGDLAVYLRRIDLRTKMAAGQSAYNLLPSVSTVFSQMQTPTYLMRVRAEYDHHDTAAMGRWGVSIVDVQRLGMRQGHYQLARTALLYGFNPAQGEGLLNANGATQVTLPADTNGHTTVLTYDPGQMATFLLSQISATKSRTYQLGQGRKFTILGPQRILSAFEYQNIVALGSYQLPGGGTTNTAGLFRNVLMNNGDSLNWCYDDTLIGKGAGGTDAVLIVMPEFEKPLDTRANTNEFAKLQQGYTNCTAMFCDMAAPREIPTPLPGGAIDVLSEMRITSGWAPRPEGVTIVSMPFQ